MNDRRGQPMDYYLNRHTEAGSTLFDVYDTAGACLYAVEGEWGSFGGKMYLKDTSGAEIAKISCVGIHGLCKYSVQIGEQEQLRVTYNLASSSSSLKLSKTDWSLRGDLLTRCFDAVDGKGVVRMTHAPCWTPNGDGYGIQVEQQADVPLALCLAVIVDNAALCGPGCAVPAN